MAKNKKKQTEDTKILDVDASMQGTITFRDPVNLRINGSFEGSLSTKGQLSIGENAVVRANIIGDNIVIAGQVFGDVSASESISVIAPAKLEGNISSPALVVSKGAIINGKINMSNLDSNNSNTDEILTLNEVAHYLEVESSVLEGWAKSKKVPSFYENSQIKFRKKEIDKWVQEEKVNV